MYGKLTLITGPMFAGKSTELLRRIQWSITGERKSVMILKPKMDTRYDENRIVSHDGYSVTAIPIEHWPEIQEGTEEVFIDEVQFLTEPHFHDDLPARIQSLLEKNISVTCSGLDMDWLGRPFAITSALCAMADDIFKLRSECSICGRPSSHTAKKQPDKKILDLGSGDLYHPLCNRHWNIFDITKETTDQTQDISWHLTNAEIL